MKKSIITITITAVIGLLALTAVAATVSLNPATVSVRTGQSFNATIALNPQGASIYTAKIQLNYPADLLSVSSFNFGESWMPISQSGYDLTDNTGGVLLKTGGYPGGLSGTATFGTVSFTAKKAGSAAISVNSVSQLLDANNQNVLTGPSGASVTISVPVITPTPTPAPAPVAPSGTEQPAAPNTEQGATINQVAPVTTQQASILGTFGNILSLGTGSKALAWIVGIIILLAIIYFLTKKFYRKPKEENTTQINQ